MNDTLLLSEISKPEYSGLDSTAAAATLRVTVTVQRATVVTDKTLAGVFGLTTAITWIETLKAIGADASNPMHLAAAFGVEWLHEGVDVSLPATRGFLDQLGGAGVFPQPQVDAVKALADVQVPKWQAIGLDREPDFADIDRVRQV